MLFSNKKINIILFVALCVFMIACVYLGYTSIKTKEGFNTISNNASNASNARNANDNEEYSNILIEFVNADCKINKILKEKDYASFMAERIIEIFDEFDNAIKKYGNSFSDNLDNFSKLVLKYFDDFDDFDNAIKKYGNSFSDNLDNFSKLVLKYFDDFDDFDKGDESDKVVVKLFGEEMINQLKKWNIYYKQLDQYEYPDDFNIVPLVENINETMECKEYQLKGNTDTNIMINLDIFLYANIIKAICIFIVNLASSFKNIDLETLESNTDIKSIGSTNPTLTNSSYLESSDHIANVLIDICALSRILIDKNYIENIANQINVFLNTLETSTNVEELDSSLQGIDSIYNEIIALFQDAIEKIKTNVTQLKVFLLKLDNNLTISSLKDEVNNKLKQKCSIILSGNSDTEIYKNIYTSITNLIKSSIYTLIMNMSSIIIDKFKFLVSDSSDSGNTGSGNTGSGNTGSGNTGSGSTGSGNTGSGNTGSGNTGSGSAGGSKGSGSAGGSKGSGSAGGSKGSGSAGGSTGNTKPTTTKPNRLIVEPGLPNFMNNGFKIPQTNLVQSHFNGTTNVYSPYLYIKEPFKPVTYDMDKYHKF